VQDFFSRVWHDLGARVSGPLSLRLFLQPTMATIFAIRDGLKDAKAGRPPYFYSLFTDPAHFRSRLSEGRHAVAKVFILAIILDSIFQLLVFKWIYPVITICRRRVRSLPIVCVGIEPAELIQLMSKPAFAPVAGTSRLWTATQSASCSRQTQPAQFFVPGRSAKRTSAFSSEPICVICESAAGTLLMT